MSIFMVRQMHDKFGFKRLAKPGFLEPEIMRMRLNFMLEELQETAEACGYMLTTRGLGTNGIGFDFMEVSPTHKKVDLEKAFDGLLDLNVVVEGTGDLMGLSNHVPETVKSRYGVIWSEGADRVHKANMTKVRVPKGGVGKRGTDHDLLKPAGWKAPEFKDLLK